MVSIDTGTRIETRDHPDSPKRAFEEMSGLAASPSQSSASGSPIFFGICDGGHAARIGIWDSGTGKRLKTLRLPDETLLENIDWEAMAIGTCGNIANMDADANENGEATCLYIGDFGDNIARESGGKRTQRNHNIHPYRILKIIEPVWSDYEDNGFISESDISVLPYQYDQPTINPFRGPYSDCEAMFIDHVAWGDASEQPGDIYLITKWGSKNKWGSKSGRTRLYKIPVSAWNLSISPSSIITSDSYYKAQAVGTYTLDSHLANLEYVTSASMSFDGTVIALGDYKETSLYMRCPGETVTKTLASTDSFFCLRYKNPSTGQGEAMTWMPGDRQTLNIPEGKKKRMGFANYDYDISNTTFVC